VSGSFATAVDVVREVPEDWNVPWLGGEHFQPATLWGAKSGTHALSCGDAAARPLGGGGASAICGHGYVGGGGGADGEHGRALYCAELRRTAVDCFVRRSRFAGQRGDAGQTGCGVLVHTKVSASIDEQSKRMSLSSSGRMRCDLR
jgi:hypothetical protein